MTRRYLPALRGIFGDWAYYSCLMSLQEVAERVRFANEIHTSKGLSDLIQRELRMGRAREIAVYLESQPERFFNSLVVAVYDGDPAWHELAHVTPQSPDIKVSDISADAIASIGFLSFTGEEKLFALDGQHRLAGIQLAVADNEALGEDEVSVIFVSHKKSAAGLIRTRRLFTTLNKTARPVNKGETISLDEADVMAITVRDLVESHKWFRDTRILTVGNTNLPATNTTHLTTIANLYDVLGVLFSKVKANVSLKDLQYNRPSDAALHEYRDFAIRYFALLADQFSELNSFLTATKPGEVVARYRNAAGGSVLFRPIGLLIFAHLTAAVIKGRSLEDAVELVGRLPTDLGAAPYEGLIWNSATQTMDIRRQALVRRLALYMLGLTTAAAEQKLRIDLARVSGVDAADFAMPKLIIPPRRRTRS